MVNIKVQFFKSTDEATPNETIYTSIITLILNIKCVISIKTYYLTEIEY